MRVSLVVLLAAALMFAALFSYPPLLEGSKGECSALEQRVSTLVSSDSSGRLTVHLLYGSTSSSPSGAAFARDHYPLLPPEIGCAAAYWKIAFGAELPAAPPPPPEAPQPAALTMAEAPEAGIIATISRDITPNGEPILAGPLFNLPMHTIAIRVDYRGGKANIARFQLMQGRAVLASCVAQKSAQAAWCRFAVELRKGNYSIAVIANNILIGRFPFTVLGA